MAVTPVHVLLNKQKAQAVLKEFATVLEINDWPEYARQYAQFSKDMEQAQTIRETVDVWKRVSGSFTGKSLSVRDTEARGKTDAERIARNKRFSPAIKGMARYF